MKTSLRTSFKVIGSKLQLKHCFAYAIHTIKYSALGLDGNIALGFVSCYINIWMHASYFKALVAVL